MTYQIEARNPRNMSLQIYFGPYEAHGVIRHKTQKLYGILTHLSNLGYEIELIPTKRLNALIVHLSEKEIYRCDIRYLMFKMDFEEDPVAQTLVNSVEETKARFDLEQNIPKFSMTKRVLTGNTQDYLSEDVELIFEIPATYDEICKRKSKQRPSQ